MKKLILSLIAVAVGTLSSFAQSDLVATLSHGSSLSTFSGMDALSQAYEAAVEGDVITLSPGVFNAVNIEKAITVRGAGMQPMESNGYVITQLVGAIRINDVPKGTTSVLTLEGINITGDVKLFGQDLAPINFLKCRFDSDVMGTGINMTAHSCVFQQLLNSNVHYNDYRTTSITCFNSAIRTAQSSGIYTDLSGLSYVANLNATNCLVGLTNYYTKGSSFSNCIILSWDGSIMDGKCNANKCMAIGPANVFENILNPSNVVAGDYNDNTFLSIFKSFKVENYNTAKFPLTEFFELTETAAATYLGDDGTQVGIYGGTNPFNPTPTNPQVTNFTVNSTTVGDQLKVKINVE